MSAGERLWWEEVVSRRLGSVTWDTMKQLGEANLNKPFDNDSVRTWGVRIAMAKVSREMHEFWAASICGDSPMELHIYGCNEEGIPSGIWILQKVSTMDDSLTIEFVQDEKYLAIPIRWEGEHV